MHWFICQPHLLKLPLQHLFNALIGATDGQGSFKCKVGKSILQRENLPVANFKQIYSSIEVSEEIVDELSWDQAYLYKLCTIVKNGNVPVILGNQKPKPVSKARWLTTLSQICRLYVAK